MRRVTNTATGQFLFNVVDNDYVPAEGESVGPFIPDVPTDADIKRQKMEATKEKYEFHRRNGWTAYQELRATIVYDIEVETINETQAFIIERYLKPGYDRIAQKGDWKTAYFELMQVTIEPEHSFAQPYMELALGYISEYIATNYEQVNAGQ